MKTGFSLNHLIQRYLRSLAPQTTIRETLPDNTTRTVRVSVQERYGRIMRLLEGDSEAVVKYREELLGNATIFDTSDLYNMIGLGKTLVGSYVRLKAMIEHPYRIRQAARMIAQYWLDNMVQVVQRHDQLQREKLRKLSQPKPAAKKGKH